MQRIVDDTAVQPLDNLRKSKYNYLVNNSFM